MSMDDDELAELISESLRRKAASMPSAAVPAHRSGVEPRRVRWVAGALAFTTVAAGAAGLFVLANRDLPAPRTPTATAPDRTAVATSQSTPTTTLPLVVEPGDLDRAAAAAGFADAVSPSAAWTVQCMVAAGAEAVYDDATGTYSYADTARFLACQRELAVLAAELPD